jgi:hypothetical protein
VLASPKAPLTLALRAALLLAAVVWMGTLLRGEHLLHFDAKAHLLVSRRTIDSLTPGWTQLGAIWLPLPHILNALPAQVDALYGTGLAACVLSFLFFALGVRALGSAAYRASGDVWAGVVAVAVLIFNPGWLYLQATPLIEALFLGCVGLALSSLVAWRVEGSLTALRVAAVASALACWVRYEAWPLFALAMTWAVLSAPPTERRRTAAIGLGAGVTAPILLYGLHSWMSTGIPFHVIGTENLTERSGDLGRGLETLAAGCTEAFGLPLLLAAGAAAVALLPRVRQDAGAALGLCALAPLAVTLTAYVAGHPPKARYALLLAPALALLLARATAGAPWLQAAAVLAAGLQLVTLPEPLPVLRESMRDRRDVVERRAALDAFTRAYQGGRLLASMGSTAPVLFELGQLGLPLREVVHEGNGHWWEYAVVDPGREVAWVMVAQGDLLDGVRQARRSFPEGFTPAFQFGRVTIYGRADRRMSGLTPAGQPGR